MCYLCIVIKKQNEMKKKTDNDLVEYERDGYGFRYYFNAGLNEETLVCDEEGIEAFEKDSNGDFHFIADIPCGYNVDNIRDMTDDEFNEFLTENGIF